MAKFRIKTLLPALQIFSLLFLTFGAYNTFAGNQDSLTSTEIINLKLVSKYNPVRVDICNPIDSCVQTDTISNIINYSSQFVLLIANE